MPTALKVQIALTTFAFLILAVLVANQVLFPPKSWGSFLHGAISMHLVIGFFQIVKLIKPL